MGIIFDIFLLILAVAPVVLLLYIVNKADKYEKEPLPMLLLAFGLGILSIPMDLITVMIINLVWPGHTVFYNAFLEAGIPEELCKWTLFMLVIWRNKNFNEFFDGIVYATFIGLGFACVENILYVFNEGNFFSALYVGHLRAGLSVPGHFLFGVIMGYCLAMAKYYPEQRKKYLIFSLIVPMAAHGIFDYILMLINELGGAVPFVGIVLFGLFVFFDIKLWKIGVKKIRAMQEASKMQHVNEIMENLDFDNKIEQ